MTELVLKNNGHSASVGVGTLRCFVIPGCHIQLYEVQFKNEQARLDIIQKTTKTKFPPSKTEQSRIIFDSPILLLFLNRGFDLTIPVFKSFVEAETDKQSI